MRLELLSTLNEEVALEIVEFLDDNIKNKEAVKKTYLIIFAQKMVYKYKIPVKIICLILGISRSWYYEKMHVSMKSDNSLNDNEIYRFIRKNIRKDCSLNRLGYKKITSFVNRELLIKNDKDPVTEYRIYRILKENNDFSDSIKNNTIHCLSRSKMNPYINWVFSKYDGKFEVSRPFELLVTDSTMIQCVECNIYFVVIIDIFGRRILGYNCGRKMDQKLFNEAYKMALKKRFSFNEFIILHGDRGSINVSKSTRKECNENGVVFSYSRTGKPLDNAVNESFFSYFKDEVLILHHRFKEKEIISIIEDYINKYNHIRPHGALENMSPKQFYLDNGYIF